MSRLYYDPPITKATLKKGSKDKSKEYLEKVAKLVPVEIITFYIAALAIIPEVSEELNYQQLTLSIIFLVGFIMTPIYLNGLAEDRKPKRIHIIVSTISYMIWAYSVSGDFIPEFYNRAISSLLLLIFTLVSGRIPLN